MFYLRIEPVFTHSNFECWNEISSCLDTFLRVHVVIIDLFFSWNNRHNAVVENKLMIVSRRQMQCKHKLHLDLFNDKEFKSIVFICLLWAHVRELSLFQHTH